MGVQRLIGANKVCYASEYSTVDPKKRLMEMKSKNMSFCNFVNMEEKMTYTPDPENPSRTLMKQETVVTVQGVPLTSYMWGIIVNTVSSNSSKGRAAIEWIVEKLGSEPGRSVFLPLWTNSSRNTYTLNTEWPKASSTRPGFPSRSWGELKTEL